MIIVCNGGWHIDAALVRAVCIGDGWLYGGLQRDIGLQTFDCVRAEQTEPVHVVYQHCVIRA